MRTVVMSSESRDIPLRNLYVYATGFLDFARNDRAFIPSDSEGSLAGRSENREMFRSLNMTRLQSRGRLCFFVMSRFVGQACRLPTLRMATGSGCPTTYRGHPIDHIFSGTSMPSNFKPRCRTRPVRSHSASRDERTG